MNESPYNVTIPSSEYALLLDMERERNEVKGANFQLFYEVTSLREEITRLREALQFYVDQKDETISNFAKKALKQGEKE